MSGSASPGPAATSGPGLFGARAPRNEDARLLTGRALFVDDVTLPGMLHAHFVRSPYAHARLRGIETGAALAMPGVVAVVTAADLGEYWQHGPLLVSPPPVAGHVFNERTQPNLAKDKVRQVGEPVAVVIAESRYLAEDAAEHVLIDYEPLPAVVELEAALADRAPLVHEDVGSNVAARVTQTKGDYAAARARAAHVISRRYWYDRGAAAAIENRGVVADWDPRASRLTIWDTTQAPIPVRNGLASMLGLAEHQVHLIAPFIGGGFGPKIMMFYPEEMVIPWLAIRLGRPVKWLEDRSENFYATTQERGQLHDAEMALDADGRILGVKDTFLHDTGCYDPYGLTVPLNSQCTLLGPYDVPAYDSTFTAVFTNKPIVTPYRGAGRQHGVFVMERLLDEAARRLGLSLPEIRRRNFLRPDAFPVNHEIIYQDFAPLVYDSGNYAPALEQALERIGWDRFVTDEQPAARAAGRHLGIGVVAYVEGTGIGPFEGARVQIESSGKVSVVTGVGTQGQGHFTVLAQIAAAQLGVDLTDVEVVTGDTDHFHWGTGTFASRGAVVAGNAVHAAACDVAAKARRLAARLLAQAGESVAPADVELADGVARLAHDPERAIGLGKLAREANPMRGAVVPGTEPGLESTQYFGPHRGATASGVHAAVVEVDPETFAVKVLRYVVVHDCGRVINPLLVDGQVHGGVAQGLGNAFYERLVWSEDGQLMNASFMDFLLPTALDMPSIEVGHEETAAPGNPLGTKGAGEAGAIPTAALFVQAVEDALAIPGLLLAEIPLWPGRLYELVGAARSAAGIDRPVAEG